MNHDICIAIEFIVSKGALWQIADRFWGLPQRRWRASSFFFKPASQNLPTHWQRQQEPFFPKQPAWGIWLAEIRQNWEEAVFYVAWYDVGKRVLEELDGVKGVKNGWHKGQEINTVTYNADQISIADIVKVLKKEGTYRGIAKE